MDRTQRTPDPSGPSTSPPAQSFTNTALSTQVTSVAPFSLDATIRALGTETEDILPALAEAVHVEIDELLGIEDTADSPKRLNIPLMPLPMGVLMCRSLQRRAQHLSL